MPLLYTLLTLLYFSPPMLVMQWQCRAELFIDRGVVSNVPAKVQNLKSYRLPVRCLCQFIHSVLFVVGTLEPIPFANIGRNRSRIRNHTISIDRGGSSKQNNIHTSSTTRDGAMYSQQWLPLRGRSEPPLPF